MKGEKAVTLEAFIIDTFIRVDNDGKEHPVDKPDQIGGAGSYAIIGARLFLPPERLGMIVDYTPESLPEEMKAKLESYGDLWDFRLRKDGQPTTRAVNKYKGQVREFAYLTPPSLLYPRDVLTAFGYPEWLHLVSFPDRATETIAQIQGVGQETGWSPGLLWEPEPPCCVPENLEVIKLITPHVDVISPNHTEAMSLFKIPTPNQQSADANSTLEWLVRRLVALKPRVGAVLRCGPKGCCYAFTADLPVHSLTYDSLNAVPVYWSAPYHLSQDKVKDPTGAGNAFMGGLMAALYEGKDMHEAVVWANVAASFIIEQDGLPSMHKVLGREVWNGDYPWERVADMQRRVEESS